MPTVRRRLDPNLRDYVLTLGEYEEDIGITSKVWARVATKKGSIVPLPFFGSLLHTIKGPFPGYDRLADRYTRDALADLIAAREVNRLAVVVSTERARAAVLLCLDIKFFDRRGRPQKIRYTYRLTGS